LRTRIQEVNEFTNELDLMIGEVRSDQSQVLYRLDELLLWNMYGKYLFSFKLQTRSEGEMNAKIKICEARIEDIGDRLRLGMGKMQAAVGESKSSKSGRNTPSLLPNEVRKNPTCSFDYPFDN